MHKIAVMGDYDSIYGFGALGIEVHSAHTQEEGKDVLKKLSSSDYAIIYITEKLASLIKEEIERFSESTLPAVILIPGVSGNTGEGMLSVKRAVEKAVGSDIL